MNKPQRKTTQKRIPVEGKKRQKAPITQEANIEVPIEQSLGADVPGMAQIKELIELIAARDFNEFELQRGGFRLRLQRGLRGAEPAAHSTDVAPAPAVPSAPVAPPTPVAQAAVPSAAPADEESLHIVTSPIVGTFYSAASPSSPPFASIGDAVHSGQTLCIIEAMKLMNEIQSDASGTVARVFVENGQPVEFGQPLFGIRTA